MLSEAKHLSDYHFNVGGRRNQRFFASLRMTVMLKDPLKSSNPREPLAFVRARET
jgi:hypothetical protein